jgi:hypothetical protein
LYDQSSACTRDEFDGYLLKQAGLKPARASQCASWKKEGDTVIVENA